MALRNRCFHWLAEAESAVLGFEDSRLATYQIKASQRDRRATTTICSARCGFVLCASIGCPCSRRNLRPSGSIRETVPGD